MIKIKDIPTRLKGLTWDEDNRLHYDSMTEYFGADNETTYNAATSEIDTINFKGEGWEIYAWYDISGFSYWMENMKEANYIQITAQLDVSELSISECNKLQEAFELAADRSKEIRDKYSYDPRVTRDY